MCHRLTSEWQKLGIYMLHVIIIPPLKNVDTGEMQTDKNMVTGEIAAQLKYVHSENACGSR